MSNSLHPDLEPWVADVAPLLGIRPDEVPIVPLLDLARDVAHDAVRPGAPVTAFMVGLALGSGRIESTEAASEEVRELAANWTQRRAAQPLADAKRQRWEDDGGTLPDGESVHA